MAHSIERIVIWCLTIGGLSFLLGFFGPIVFAPGANQGPLLGIFITGPLGAVVGLAVGVVREFLGYTGSPLQCVQRWSGGERATLERMTGEGSAGELSSGERMTGEGSAAERSAENGTIYLRYLAMVVGGFLGVYGVVGLREGVDRGVAATLVVATAAIFYGVTGRVPSFFRR